MMPSGAREMTIGTNSVTKAGYGKQVSSLQGQKPHDLAKRRKLSGRLSEEVLMKAQKRIELLCLLVWVEAAASPNHLIVNKNDGSVNSPMANRLIGFG